MATTVNEVLNIVMAKINQIDPDGTIDTADYAPQFPYLCDSRQRKLMMIGDMYKSFEFINKPVIPNGGILSGFDVLAYEGVEKTDEYNKPVQAYSIYVTYAGTFYIEDFTGSWNTLATVTWTGGTNIPVRKYGLVTGTSGATKSRIRYVGTNRYTVKDRALFDVPFASASEIPDYGRYVKMVLPTDLKSKDQIIRSESPDWYSIEAQTKWEGRSTMYYNYYLDGALRIVYRPVPAKITALTDTLEIDDITATTILPAWLAYDLYMHDDNNLALQFRREAEGLEAVQSVKGPASSSTMVDVYGGI
jgi:hypothetical protein